MKVEARCFSYEFNNQDELDQVMEDLFLRLQPDELGSVIDAFVSRYKKRQAKALGKTAGQISGPKIAEHANVPAPLAPQFLHTALSNDVITHKDMTLASPAILRNLKLMLEGFIQKRAVGNFVTFYQTMAHVDAFKDVFREMQKEKGLFILNCHVMREHWQLPGNVSISMGPKRKTLLHINSANHNFADVLSGKEKLHLQWNLRALTDSLTAYRENGGRVEWLSGLEPAEMPAAFAQVQKFLSFQPVLEQPTADVLS